MSKVSQLDKALASLKAERDVLDLAIRKLEAQQTAKPTKPRKVKPNALKGFDPQAALDVSKLTQSS